MSRQMKVNGTAKPSSQLAGIDAPKRMPSHVDTIQATNRGMAAPR